jgi:hypothetical protein
MSILVIDGVKYEEWTPKTEDDFERVVKEHAKDIFGEQSIYLDLKQKLKSKAGIGSIPDGYALTLADDPDWYIVEIELSSHPVFEHIVSQINKFTVGIKSPHIQTEIMHGLYQEISKDEVLKERIASQIGSAEIFKFVSDLVSRSPKLAIIIDEETEELREAVDGLKLETRVVEFRSFAKQNTGILQHAHLFEPISLWKGEVTSHREFLNELRMRFAKQRPEVKTNKPGNRYCKIPIAHGDVHLEWLVYEGEGKLGIELHLERRTHQENLYLFQRLNSKRDEIAKSVGTQLLTDSQWLRNGARIYTQKEIEPTDEFKEWAVETMIKFYDVLKPILDKIDV